MEEQKMESQSRYSIVERITRMKMDIMDNINSLDVDVINKEQELREVELNYKDWKETHMQEKERTDRQFQRNINGLKSDLEIVKERKKQVKLHYEKKIVELNTALKAVEEISKTAPNPQDQK